LGLNGYSQTIDSLEKVTELKSVKVNGKRIKPIEIINKSYTNGLFSSMSRGRTYDLINNPLISTRQGGSILLGGVVKVKFILIDLILLK